MADRETHDGYLEEVWSLFAEEGKEALDLVEETLLELESDPTDARHVAKLFRAMHTFKGETRMMGLSVIESLAHHAEDLVALVRDEGVALTGAMVDLLLEVLDHSRVMLDHALVHRHDADAAQVEGLVARLKVMLAEHSEQALRSRKISFEDTDEGTDGSDETPVPSMDEEFILTVPKETIDPATDPEYVRIFLEMAEEESGRLHTVLGALAGGDEERDIQGIKAVADTLMHAAGRMGYDRLVAILDDLMTAVKGLDGEVQVVRLNELELALSDELAAIQDTARSLGLEVSVQLPMRLQVGLSMGRSSADEGASGLNSSHKPQGFIEDGAAVPGIVRLFKHQTVQEPARQAKHIAGPQSATFMKVLTDLVENVGKLAAARATLHRVAERLAEVDLVETVTRLVIQTDSDWERTRREVQTALESWADDLHTLGQVETEMGATLDQLQETVLALRDRPAAEMLAPLPRLVQDVAQYQGKMVELDLKGGDVLLDHSALDTLADPVRCLVWFAVAHDIEEPVERQEADKPAAGRVSVVVRKTADHVQVVVEDDGRGIDPDATFRRARELGWMNDIEGIDLAAIKSKLQAHRGRLGVTSEPGKSTRFLLELPLDMVVIDGMVMRVGDVHYVVPVGAIRRIVKPEEAQIVRSSADGGQIMLRLGEGLIPIQTLMGGAVGHALDKGLLLVVEKDEQGVALTVDEVIGQQQVLIRPLQGYLADIQSVSGYALLGEGDVGMVLDPNQLNVQVHK